MNDERLREIWRSAPGGGRTSTAAGCPDDETIWAARKGELPEERVHEILEHSRTCAACAESWALAAAIGAEERPVPASLPRRRAWPLLAAAAVAALALVAAPLALRRASEPPRADPFRAPGAGAMSLRSTLDESRPVPRADCRLRWTGAPARSVFSVEIATEELRVLDRVEGLEEQEYLVPETALAKVASGSTILWHVVALLPDGKRVESVMFRARIE
jgi:hypothetical protein